MGRETSSDSGQSDGEEEDAEGEEIEGEGTEEVEGKDEAEN